MGVLLLLLFTGRRLTPSEIGDQLVVTRGNMTGLVKGLVRDKLVRRVRKPGDRRAHDLELTERGRGLVFAYLPHHFGALAKNIAGLTPDEALTLARLLHKLRAGMEPLTPLAASRTEAVSAGDAAPRR
jgi:DNA-binding MarR family transcriptional regulator